MHSFKRCLFSFLHQPATDEDLKTLRETEDGGASFSTKYAFPVTASRSIKKVVLNLLPQPVQHHLAPLSYKTPRIHPTSYIDGLRGIASLLVFLHHYTTNWVGPYKPYYGVDIEKRPSSLLQLPFVRVIWAGRPMVHVFFVISGFVLSRKSLKLARAHNYDDLHKTLSSLVFRRALRLYLPAAFSTFFVLLLIRTGWARQPVDGGFSAQVADWISAMFDMTKPWKWDVLQELRYDLHTWTLPVEMSMSMLSFVTITGLSRCRVPIRLGMVTVIMLYCFQSGHWAAVEFLAGAFIAEVDLIQDARACEVADPQPIGLEGENDKTRLNPAGLASTSADERPKSATLRSLFWTLFWWLQLIIALWICGWPNEDVEKAPGLAWLVEHTPEPYLSLGKTRLIDWRAAPWYLVASLQIVFACQQLRPLQRFLNTAPIQYLASVSFALYLMHGPLFDSIGLRIMSPIYHSVTSMDEAGVWELFFVWVAGLLALGIPCLWSADLFWRFIDRPCVDFARWAEKKCIV